MLEGMYIACWCSEPSFVVDDSVASMSNSLYE
jgi:hypothetical protein